MLDARELRPPKIEEEVDAERSTPFAIRRRRAVAPRKVVISRNGRRGAWLALMAPDRRKWTSPCDGVSHRSWPCSGYAHLLSPRDRRRGSEERGSASVSSPPASLDASVRSSYDHLLSTKAKPHASCGESVAKWRELMSPSTAHRFRCRLRRRIARRRSDGIPALLEDDGETSSNLSAAGSRAVETRTTSDDLIDKILLGQHLTLVIVRNDLPRVAGNAKLYQLVLAETMELPGGGRRDETRTFSFFVVHVDAGLAAGSESGAASACLRREELAREAGSAVLLAAWLLLCRLVDRDCDLLGLPKPRPIGGHLRGSCR